MATNRDLLKEAIADAKAVKEMAIANAKTALEEAFTPRLKEMLSAKIQEMDEEESTSMEEMKYEEDDTKVDEAKEEVEEAGFESMIAADNDQGFDSLKGNIPEGENDLDEMDLEEILAELEEEEKVEESLNEAEEEDEVEDEEESEEEEGEPLDLEDMTDEDLKKMIEDVIADMVASGELEGGDVEDEEEEGEEMEMSDEEEEVDLAELLKEIEEEMEETNEEMSDEATAAKIDKELKLEEAQTLNEEPFTLATLALIGGGVSALVGSGIGYAAIMNRLEKKAKEGSEKAKKILATMGGMGSAAGKQTRSGGSSATMKEENSELQSEIKSLKSDLNEAVKETNATNLLNAKLLYTNKIFKAKNLNESQKVKVLSSFDKANTVKEAKLVYETLSEGLKVKKSTIKENLGRASKATTIPTTKKPIVESNDVFARMQKLAGIIK